MRIQMATLPRGAVACAAFCIGASAFAANPIASEKIAVAKASVQRAEQSGAPEARARGNGGGSRETGAR